MANDMNARPIRLRKWALRLTSAHARRFDRSELYGDEGPPNRRRGCGGVNPGRFSDLRPADSMELGGKAERSRLDPFIFKGNAV